METWVFIHGTLTAIIQPGIGWQIFSYGFMIMFLVNQIFQTRIGESKLALTVIYSLFAYSAYLGFKSDKAYYRATFIPMSEYLCLYFTLGMGKLTLSIVNRVPTELKKPITVVSYIGVSTALTVGLAVTLAGNIRVYNDY